MNRRKLFLDFDNTIVNSTQKFCSVYNQIYSIRKDFVPAKWYEVEKYNFSDQCPLISNVNDIFGNPLFFYNLDFINDNTYEVLQQLNENYHIIIASIGVPKNLSLKAIWLENNLPFITNYILLNNGNCKMQKEIIDMRDSILIDDVTSNLISSNAECKIRFGDEFSWNRNWNGLTCVNWTDVGTMLL
jgi:5'(3')-deoxyribonucleotidase